MIKDKIKKFFSVFKKLLFPEYSCYICGLELENPDEHICERCKNNLVRTDGNICLVCGEPIPEPNKYCDICSEESRPFDLARTCFIYNDYSAKLVMGLKYQSNKYMIKYMAKELAVKLLDFGVLPDIIVPVPITQSRLKQRGFNQSELLANAVNELCGNKMEIMPGLVKRIKERPPQASLNRKERLVNLIDAFEVDKTLNISGKIVMILDDVYTTGTTVSEIAKVLRKRNPEGIFVLTFAKTKHNPPLP